MSSMEMELLQAELTEKTSLIGSLTADNEQLRRLLQSSSDSLHNTSTDVKELQTHNARLSAQVKKLSEEKESSSLSASQLGIDVQDARAALSATTHENGMLKEEVKALTAQLLDESKKYEDERGIVINLRAALEESKKAIAILSSQQERRDRGSEAALARRASVEILAGKSPNLSKSVGASAGAPHEAFNPARRGSLNYLSGLGLTSKRLTHFDPRHRQISVSSDGGSESQANNIRASLPGSVAASNDQSTMLLHPDSMTNHVSASRRASLPAGAVAPNSDNAASRSEIGLAEDALNQYSMVGIQSDSPMIGNTSRRSSMTAATRRSSNVLDPGMRRASLAAVLNLAEDKAACTATGDIHDTEGLPTYSPRRRRSHAEFSGDGPTFADKVRRRSSAQLHGLQISSSSATSGLGRRNSDHRWNQAFTLSSNKSAFDSPLAMTFSAAEVCLTRPTPVDELAEDPFTTHNRVQDESRHSELARQPAIKRPNVHTFSPEMSEVVQALSVEAAMEISSLRDVIADLKMQLLEAEESREASETIARALREFIAATPDTPNDKQKEVIRLPAPPSGDTSDMDTDEKNTSKKEKRTSRWGMLLPSITVPALASGQRRDASNSIVNHLPLPPKPAVISTHLNKSPQLSVEDSHSRGSYGSTGNSPSFLQQPTWRTNGYVRNLSVASGASTVSARPSPILSPGVEGFAQDKTNFMSFSFSAHQERSDDEFMPSSPGGSRHSTSPDSTYSARLERISSEERGSISEVDSMPPTPLDAVFNATETAYPPSQKAVQSFADTALTPRIVSDGFER